MSISFNFSFTFNIYHIRLYFENIVGVHCMSVIETLANGLRKETELTPNTGLLLQYFLKLRNTFTPLSFRLQNHFEAWKYFKHKNISGIKLFDTSGSGRTLVTNICISRGSWIGATFNARALNTWHRDSWPMKLRSRHFPPIRGLYH